MALTIDDLRKAVSYNARFGLDYEALGEQERYVVDESIKDGVNAFVYASDTPSPTSGPLCYEWSFRRPTLRLSTIAQQWQYPAPPGLFRIEGRLHDAGTDHIGLDVPVLGIGMINEARSRNSNPGRPAMASFELASVAGAAREAYEISFYPTPDAAYTYVFTGLIEPQEPSEALPYLPAGDWGRSAIIECCLAAWEKRFGDKSGVHTAIAQVEVAKAISFDRSRPVNEGGYNSGNVIEYDFARWGQVGNLHRIAGLVTYEPGYRYTG